MPQSLHEPSNYQQKISRDPLSIGSAKNGTLRRLKTVLYWNEFYGRYDTYDFGYGHEAFVEKQCAVTDCFATKVCCTATSYSTINPDISPIPIILPHLT